MEQFYYGEREKGKGFDPVCKGFQVAACSPGLDEASRGQLAEITVHYGKTVLDGAPKAAKELERQYRLSDDEELEPAPADLVAAYPPVFACCRLAGGRMAVSRASYRGFVMDGRPGNYFVHSLIYHPVELADRGHHPLRLASSLLAADPGGEGVLAAIAAPPADTASVDLAPLRQPGLLQALPALIAALLAAGRGGRPVVVTLPTYQEALPFLSALLSLLPPHSRSRLSFCSNEIDVRWRPTSGGDGAIRPGAHDLILCCGPDNATGKLGAEDYAVNFAVFNFTEGRISDSPAPGDYARFAADCLGPGGELRLRRHHDLADRLGLADRPETWDVLVRAIGLLDNEAGGETLAEALSTLLGLDLPEGGDPLWDLLGPHLQRLAASGAYGALQSLAGPLGRLGERLTAAAAVDLQRTLSALAATAFAEGRAQLSEALARAAGTARPSLVHQAVVGAPHLPAPTRFTGSGEARAAAGLVAEALAAAGALPPGRLPELLALAFATAAAAGMTAELWSRLGGQVRAYLGDVEEAEHPAFLNRLLPLLPASACPEGFAELTGRLLTATRPEGAELLKQLTAAIKAVERLPQLEGLAATLLAAADGLLTDPPARALLRGRLALAFAGGLSAGLWQRAWHQAIAGVADPLALRLALAESGGEGLIAGEILAALAAHPASEALGPFRQLIERPAVFAQVADRLEKDLDGAPVSTATRLQVAALLAFCHGMAGNDGRRAALHDRLLLATPLAELATSTAAPSTASALSVQVAERLRAAAFLLSLREASVQPGWGLAELPVAGSFWQEELPRLSPATRRELLDFVSELVAALPLMGLAELSALRQLLAAEQKTLPRDLAEALTRRVDRGRPGLLAYLRLVIASAKAEPEAQWWLEVAETLVERLEVGELELLQVELTPPSPPGENAAPGEESPGQPPQTAIETRLVQAVATALAVKKPPLAERYFTLGHEGREKPDDREKGGLNKLFSGFKKLWGK